MAPTKTLPVTINGNKCQVTEIKRESLKCPETVPVIHEGEKVKSSCEESTVKIKIERSVKEVKKHDYEKE